MPASSEVSGRYITMNASMDEREGARAFLTLIRVRMSRKKL